MKEIDPQLRDRFEFLGRISEQEKADFMSSVSLYVAPNTGGESFGIILAEALAGGACVVASDIPAFNSLLGAGEFGALFESENSTDLAKVIIDLLRDENKRKALASAGKNMLKFLTGTWWQNKSFQFTRWQSLEIRPFLLALMVALGVDSYLEMRKRSEEFIVCWFCLVGEPLVLILFSNSP